MNSLDEMLESDLYGSPGNGKKRLKFRLTIEWITFSKIFITVQIVKKE